jgi:hypothetical protein
LLEPRLVRPLSDDSGRAASVVAGGGGGDVGGVGDRKSGVNGALGNDDSLMSSLSDKNCEHEYWGRWQHRRQKSSNVSTSWQAGSINT